MRRPLLVPTLLLVLWLAGLLGSFVFATFSRDDGLLLSAVAVVGSILGYHLLGGQRDVFWRVQLAIMVPLGSFMVVHPLVDWHNGVPQSWLPIPLGFLFIGMAFWGLWPNKPALIRQPT